MVTPPIPTSPLLRQSSGVSSTYAPTELLLTPHFILFFFLINWYASLLTTLLLFFATVVKSLGPPLASGPLISVPEPSVLEVLWPYFELALIPSLPG